MRWARENPERYSEISALPPSQQNAELRDAIGYDPDLIREELKERERCLCGVTESDSFGNRDPIENSDCPLHGPAPKEAA